MQQKVSSRYRESWKEQAAKAKPLPNVSRPVTNIFVAEQVAKSQAAADTKVND